jgi:hypothetical protein
VIVDVDRLRIAAAKAAQERGLRECRPADVCINEDDVILVALAAGDEAAWARMNADGTCGYITSFTEAE